MGVTADGWLDWAIRMPRTDGQVRVNSGVNSAKGIFLHSAEGYAEVLLRLATTGPLSWHASNLMDGRLIQHYPFTARCWHATAANDDYVGMENEGYAPREPSLNEVQIANARRVIADLSAWKGWTPRRPSSPADVTHTLWEHREVVRLGGTATSCPSGRIPWPAILAGSPPADEEDEMTRHNSIAPALQGSGVPVQVNLTDFEYPPPQGTKRLRVELYLKDGDVQVLDSDGRYAGRVGWDGARYGVVDVDVSAGIFALQGNGSVAQIGIVAYA